MLSTLARTLTRSFPAKRAIRLTERKPPCSKRNGRRRTGHDAVGICRTAIIRATTVGQAVQNGRGGVDSVGLEQTTRLIRMGIVAARIACLELAVANPSRSGWAADCRSLRPRSLRERRHRRPGKAEAEGPCPAGRSGHRQSIPDCPVRSRTGQRRFATQDRMDYLQASCCCATGILASRAPDICAKN